MNWIDIEDLKTNLKLKSSSENPTELRKEIRQKMKSIHPDGNDGKFESKKLEEEFNKLSDAKDFIDQQASNNALVPVKQLPSIIKAINEAQLQPVEK